jgi:molybdopterin-containing oxidoreductase family iron-sulfur binding subunit
MPVAFTKQFTKNRKLENGNTNMSKLVVIESNMSLTGSNADERYTIKPSEEASLLLNLYNKIASIAGHQTYSAPEASIDLAPLAAQLIEAKGKSLVVCGSNHLNSQLIVNAINQILENYGATLDLNRSINLYQGSDEKMTALVDQMNNGQVNMLICWNANPVYELPNANGFIEGLKKVETAISFADRTDETASLCTYICPDHNYLESWDDAEPLNGSYSMMQPAIHNIFDTRQAQNSLLKWMGKSEDWSEYLEAYWETDIFPNQSFWQGFRPFWNQCKHDGVFESEPSQADPGSFTTVSLVADTPSEAAGFELAVYEKIGIGTGKHSNNPWLMELPDPVTKATWDNYLTISPADASSHGLQQEDVVKFANGFQLPVLIQAGQAKGTLGVAIGFGRSGSGPVANGIGANAFGLMRMEKGLKVANTGGITLEKTGKRYQLALTQMQHTMEGRNVVKETSLAAFIQSPDAGNEDQKYTQKHAVTLYPEVKYDGFHWGLAIDLNSCTGCGNCVISCQAENNVSVVGKDEVRRNRNMHWIRIDRYYSEDAENPKVFHQPVMCQHCDNAPCENVCPVAATNHSSEGLNQMAYNRCIGTKYCMNNCPYRVRRFNWFSYINNPKFNFNKNSDLGKMVLNPDVTVRERGVVEKCSFCVQRIQEKKLTAKKENRKLEDLEIKPACMQSCPGDAMVFGNMNDPQSKVSLLMKSERRYRLVEELHTLPSVSYLTKVRNTSGA